MCRWILGGALLCCAALAALLLPSLSIRGLASEPLGVAVPPETAQTEVRSGLEEIEVRAPRPRVAAPARVAVWPRRRTLPRPVVRGQTRPTRSAPAPQAPQQRQAQQPAPKTEPEPAVETRVFMSRALRVVEPPRGKPVLDETDEKPVKAEEKTKDDPPRPAGGKHKE